MTQLPFGLEIHWPKDATEWSAWATLALVLVTGVYVWFTRQSVSELRSGTEKSVRELRASTERNIGELREVRYAEFTPMLRWQSPEARVELRNTGAWEMQLDVLLSNEGPGAARIYDYTVKGRHGPRAVRRRREFRGCRRGETLHHAEGWDAW